MGVGDLLEALATSRDKEINVTIRRTGAVAKRLKKRLF